MHRVSTPTRTAASNVHASGRGESSNPGVYLEPRHGGSHKAHTHATGPNFQTGCGPSAIRTNHAPFRMAPETRMTEEEPN